MLLGSAKHIGGKRIPSRTGRYLAPKRSLSWRSGRTLKDVVRKTQLEKKAHGIIVTSSPVMPSPLDASSTAQVLIIAPPDLLRKVQGRLAGFRKSSEGFCCVQASIELLNSVHVVQSLAQKVKTGFWSRKEVLLDGHCSYGRSTLSVL